MKERDTRYLEIKKILRDKYPQARFKVRIEKFTGGESIWIHTDLFTESEIEKREAITRKIEKLLGKYWHVEYDQFTGEGLCGVGNTYLEVEAF